MDDGQPIGPLAQTAGGGNPQQGQLFQMMMDSAQKKQGYLQQQQEAYNADLDKYAQMVQNSQQPGANEAQMWGNMAQAAGKVAPTWGNTGAMIAGIGGAYGDQQAQEMQQNLKNQSDLTKLRQNEVRALEAKDQQVQMMKALGGGNKQVTPEQLRTVYTSARNEAAQIAKDHKWESAEQRGAWIEQYSKRAVDEYRNQYQLNTGASYGAGGDKGAPMPSAPVAKEELTTKIDQSLDDKLRQLSPDDNATAIRLINRIAANPQTASNDGKTLQGILDRYYPDGKPQAVAQRQDQGKVVAPPMRDKAAEAGDVVRAEEMAKVETARKKDYEKEMGAGEAKFALAQPEALSKTLSVEAGTDELLKMVNEAKTHKGLASTVGMEGLLPFVGRNYTAPSSDSADFQSRIDSLKKRMSATELQNLKAAGVSMGAMTEGEWKIMEDQVASLNYSTSEKEFRKKLDDIGNFYEKAKKRVRESYNRQYGKEQKPETSTRRVYNPATGRVE